ILVFYISAPPPPALSPLSLTTLFRSRLCRNIGPYRLRSTGDLQYRCEARSQSDFFICGAALRAGSEMRLNLQLLISRELLMVVRSEEHTSELQSRFDLVCRRLLEKKE